MDRLHMHTGHVLFHQPQYSVGCFFCFFCFLLTYSKIPPPQFVKRMLHKNQFQQITTEQFSTSLCRKRRNSKYCSVKVFTSMTRSASAVFHLFLPDSFLPPRCFSSSCFEFISSSPPSVCVRVRVSPCLFVSITLALCVKLWNASATDHLSVSCEACAGRFRI